MEIPRKRISISKKRICRNIWKKKGHWVVVKAFSLAKSISTEHSKSFFVRQTSNKALDNLNRHDSMNWMIYKMNNSH